MWQVVKLGRRERLEPGLVPIVFLGRNRKNGLDPILLAHPNFQFSQNLFL